MSPVRSPTNNASGGGSQPDLSKLSNNMEFDTTNKITQRKRKNPFEHDCKCVNEIKELRKELSRMTSLLEKYTESNENLMVKMQDNIAEVKTQVSEMKATTEKSTKLIRGDITEIRTQITEIKSSSENIATEQKTMKAQVSLLESKIAENDIKIKSIQSNSAAIKSTSAQSQAHMNEELLREAQERVDRERNIIVVGLPEQTSETPSQRASKDEDDVIRITRSIVPDTPHPLRVIRIGRYNEKKIRRIKVSYEHQSYAKQILRNKHKLSEDISIYSDQTPSQHKYLLNLKEELARRVSDGETDLTIKYINNIPSIVKITPKNSNL